MIPEQTRTSEFTEFARDAEPKLRVALCSAFGRDAGRDAAAEALAYGWEHWARVSGMDNPVGYLFVVGRDRARRSLTRRSRRRLFESVSVERLPWVEPGLAAALGRLSERQRVVVMLVHGLDWTHSETAELIGVSPSTVQVHLERGMSRLRRALGTES